MVLATNAFAHFNPRSRKGSDRDKQLSTKEHTDISIHAPAKGATNSAMFL